MTENHPGPITTIVLSWVYSVIIIWRVFFNSINSKKLDSSSESESRLTPRPSPPRAIQNYRPSCDTEVLAVVRERDRQLRLGILQMATEPDTEEDLVLHIILLRVFANSFPYVHLHEWEVVPGRSQFGKGDLVFTDGKDSYLIVECKYINHDSGKTARARRRNKRRKVEYQAKMYAENFLRHRQPGAKSISFVPITNEEDRSIRTAEKRIQMLDL